MRLREVSSRRKNREGLMKRWWIRNNEIVGIAAMGLLIFAFGVMAVLTADACMRPLITKSICLSHREPGRSMAGDRRGAYEARPAGDEIIPQQAISPRR